MGACNSGMVVGANFAIFGGEDTNIVIVGVGGLSGQLSDKLFPFNPYIHVYRPNLVTFSAQFSFLIWFQEKRNIGVLVCHLQDIFNTILPRFSSFTVFKTSLKSYVNNVETKGQFKSAFVFVCKRRDLVTY